MMGRFQQCGDDGWMELEAGTSLLALANEIGVPVPPRPHAGLVDVLHPRTSSQASHSSLSSVFGRQAFPFHTDGAFLPIPPRWILLRAIELSENAPPTLILPLETLALSDGDVEVLERPLWTVTGRRPFLAAILERHPQTGPLLRFDPCCMKARTNGAAKTQKLIEDRADAELPSAVDWHRGRTILIDNWRALHARPDCSGVSLRTIERVIIQDKRIAE